jgi:hypothetical protein
MTQKTLNRSFAAGEISPQLFSRLDLDKFQTGVAKCLNCETLPQGPIQNRAGFQWVLEAADSSRPVVLIPFSYSTQQTFALEFSNGLVRFHTQGGTLLENPVEISAITNDFTAVFTTAALHGYTPGQWAKLGTVTAMPLLSGRWIRIKTTPTTSTFTATDLFSNIIDTSAMPVFYGNSSVSRVYQIATPYAAEDLAGIHYVQSADVLTLVHPKYAPRELRRKGATDWELNLIQFTSSLSPPQSNGAIPSAIAHTYRVVPVFGQNPGLPSAPTSCNNDLTIPGHFNSVGWASVSGAVSYLVYKLLGGVWNFLGSSVSTPSFIDDSSVVPNPSVPLFSAPGPTTTAVATPISPASAGVSVVPTGAGATSYTYVVTSLNADATEESIASGGVTVLNDLSTAPNKNTVLWPAVPGVTLYNVYRGVNGIFGLLGRADHNCRFEDQNILPDASNTPPTQINPFLGDGNFPRAVSYHQQRRVFGGTINAPQNVWMTRSGTERNLGFSFPSRDDDGITLRVVSREANTVRHMIPMNDLILLTSGGEWLCSAADTGALTPSNVSVKPQGYTGASEVQPVVTDRTILFAQDRGGYVRELQFSWEQQGYQTANASILAPHLFDYFTIKQMAFCRSPIPSLWAVRSDGALLGLTYVPEHEIRAWHQHTTEGVFESVCSVSEGDEDSLYAVVRRTISGRVVRYIERKHTRRFDTPADQFFVDSGLTYSGPPVSTFVGLYHLEGKTVSILADGGVSPQQVVRNGSVVLDAPASKVHVGLPYVSQIQTLPLSMQTQAFGQGSVKNINKVHLRVLASQSFEAGPTFAKVRPYASRSSEPYGTPPDLLTTEVPITLSPEWQRNGQVCIQQSQPLSMMVLGMAIEVATGS